MKKRKLKLRNTIGPKKKERTQVNALLAHKKGNSPIKRALLFHTPLTEDNRRKYEHAKTNREKQLIAKVVS